MNRTKNWYENEARLAAAIQYILEYSCIFGWSAYASNSTPCCKYKEEDQNIPEGLRQAIGAYLDHLSAKERQSLNAELALLLGERFFVRRKSIIKVFSRILASGDPHENKDMIAYALQVQIRQRMELLEKLRAS